MWDKLYYVGGALGTIWEGAGAEYPPIDEGLVAFPGKIIYYGFKNVQFFKQNMAFYIY